LSTNLPFKTFLPSPVSSGAGENLKFWNPENLAGRVAGEHARFPVFQVFSFPAGSAA
jgi:hypothetical protein